MSAFLPPLHNLYRALPDASQAEQFSDLLSQPGLRIERIVSRGQASPPDFWYEQDEGEWVILLQGAARLRFADSTTSHALVPGAYVHIAPRRRHRVDWTDPEQDTVWLAVFYSATNNAPNDMTTTSNSPAL